MISSSHGPSLRKILLLILLVSLVGSAWLTTLVDDGLGLTWTQKVVRNWDQLGFFHLHGGLVENPGGYQVETQPKVYPGHRAVSLYPVFLCYQVFSGMNLGFLSYYALIAGVVALAIWHLLGRTERAFWLAATVVLTPGYVRWQTTLDPNLAVVLLGFPYCAAVLGLLRRATLQPIHWLALLVLIVGFSSVNWSAVFVHAMLFATLLVLPRMSWRNLFIYAGLTAVAAGAVLLVSVASKMSGAGGSASGGGLVTMLRGYGWGNIGYGEGLSTKTAFLRLLSANLLGLLPVLIFLAWQFVRRGGFRAIPSWRFLLPALMPVIEVLGMRNYFGHHPWMSVHYILLGMILATVVWKQEAGPAAESASPRSVWVWRSAGLAATFLYAFVLLSIGRVHGERELGLAALVLKNTSRDTTIVIARDTDQGLVTMEERLPELLDRRLVVLPSVDQSSVAGLPAKALILTGVAPQSGKVLARTDEDGNSASLAKTLLAWYSRNIANRRPGDKLEIGDAYFLYQPPG